jgi:hypothetical protein
MQRQVLFGLAKGRHRSQRWKAPERLNDSGKACLLLPTAVLLNKTDKFQAAWFSQVTVEKVVNFSDLRRVLFADAIHPGIAVRFNKTTPDIAKDRIRYESPKTDIRSQVGGAVYIYDEDIKTIRLSELLSKAQSKEAARVWKTQFWGTWRDLKFLQRLSDMPRLKDALKDIRTGVGIQPEGGDPNPIWWEKDRPFLDANNKFIQLVVTQDDCYPVGNMFPDKIHRPRTQEIFSPPLLVFNKGFSKISFVGFPVLFTDSLFSISSYGGDDSVLRFLVALLRSHLAKYYYFHTVSNYGIERTQLFTEQITDCPFLIPKDTQDPKKSEEIICEVSNKLQNFETNLRNRNYTVGRLEKVRQIQDECEPLIRQYYDIDDYERILIEDTVDYIIPSITPSENKKIKTLRPADTTERQQYTETLCQLLNIYAKEGKKVEGHIVKADSQAIVVISRANGKSKPYYETSASQEIRQVLGRIHKLLPATRGGFVYCRNLKIFDKDHVYIVKPMTLRSWMRSTALNDADEIASAVLKGGEKR